MIRTKYGTYDGDSWEQHCQVFLKRKYEDEGYQEVVAHTHGDLGIEGFTRRTGRVFQCYCPDEECSSAQLYEAQRDKVTRDLKKLIVNRDELKRYLGNTKIREWNFLTPIVLNKELIAHCSKKADEYKEIDDLKGLLEGNFDVLVKDEGFFSQEILWTKTFLGNRLEINTEVIGQSDVANWKECESVGVQTLIRKISKVFEGQENQSQKTNQYVDHVVRDHMQGIQVTAMLQSNYPLLFEKQATIKASVERQLEKNVLLLDIPPKEHLLKAMSDYRDALRSADIDSVFEYNVVEDLCNEAIADWLIRCPMNFGGV